MVSKYLSFFVTLTAIIIGDVYSLDDDNKKTIPKSLANIHHDNIEFFKGTKNNNATTAASMLLHHSSSRKLDEHRGSLSSGRRRNQWRSNSLPTIASIVGKKSQPLETLEKALEAVQFLDVFRSNNVGPFTLFAPANSAFSELGDLVNDLLKPENVNTLAYILQYHIVEGLVYAEELEDGPIETFFGSIINVDVNRNWNGNRVTLNDDSNVLVPNLRASNGIVHIIDSVLLPKTVIDVAEESGFSSLVAAIDKAGLRNALNGPGPFTVFAPTNRAFQSLGPLQNFRGSDLKPVLLYHVIDDLLITENDLREGTVKTMEGHRIKISFEEKTRYWINNWQVEKYVQITGADSVARVTMTDVFASNGIIHVINGVLLP